MKSKKATACVQIWSFSRELLWAFSFILVIALSKSKKPSKCFVGSIRQIRQGLLNLASSTYVLGLQEKHVLTAVQMAHAARRYNLSFHSLQSCVLSVKQARAIKLTCICSNTARNAKMHSLACVSTAPQFFCGALRRRCPRE